MQGDHLSELRLQASCGILLEVRRDELRALWSQGASRMRVSRLKAERDASGWQLRSLADGIDVAVLHIISTTPGLTEEYRRSVEVLELCCIVV